MSLLSLLFGCKHPRTTFPQTAKGEARPHVTCLDCGRSWVYDWRGMRVENKPGKTALMTSRAAPAFPRPSD